ncbi:MAG: WG repeat-containing protein [Armatimonadota bacterium]|jgi:hypothetical protein|nr:WG repeat-containing protein [Armatimonadota bacterium]
MMSKLVYRKSLVLLLAVAYFCVHRCEAQQLYVTPTAQGWGFIDSSGKLTIDGTFTSVQPFAEGMAVASNGDKYGFIGTHGETVIPFGFDKANSFSEGLAAVKISGKWGFINKQGSFVIRPQFLEEPRRFVDGYSMNGAHLGSKSMVIEKDFFIDKRGNRITPPGAIMLMPFREGFAWRGEFDSQARQRWTVIDKNFHAISESMLLCFVPNPFSDGMSVVQFGACQWSEKQSGYVSVDGKIAIGPSYESAWDFKGGLARVKVDGKYGFISKTGELKIEPQFDNAFNFSDGLAAVVKDSELGFIDAEGNFAIPLQFNDAMPLDQGFVGDLAGIILVQSRSPIKLAVIYVNRKGKVIYGPVNLPFHPHQ